MFKRATWFLTAYVLDELVNALAVAGLVRVGEEDGRVIWPVAWSSWDWWRDVALGRLGARAGLFTNVPGVVRDVPGRWLPRRWGFYVLGFELGDRGGGSKLVLRRGGLPFVAGWARVLPGARYDDGTEVTTSMLSTGGTFRRAQRTAAALLTASCGALTWLLAARFL
jgi:hypothetical protein